MRTLACNRYRRFAQALLTLCLCTSTPAGHANDLELGMQALEMGHAAQAIQLWRPLAKAGNVDAQFGLGVIYNDAMGVEQDYVEANYWFLRAAEQGYAPAQFNLGNAYKNGTGMKIDPTMAVIWWRKAAEQGFGPAQFNLGSALMEGAGTPRDRKAGLEWYRRAAANGHTQAQRYLEKQTAATPPAAKSNEERATAAPTQAARALVPKAPDTAMTGVAGTASTPVTHDTKPGEIHAPANCADWLDQDANTYTVQLMASRDEADVHTYIAQHALTDTAICHYQVKGKLWHSLQYGRYESAAGARAALAALPEEVRAGGGYVRRIAEIRDAVNKR